MTNTTASPVGDAIFEMNAFSPLAHPNNEYKKILERNACIVIFEELMKNVKFCLTANKDANMIATGNPGTGKSRFYLYCIFQLIFQGDNKHVKALPTFILVIDFCNKFLKCDDNMKEFSSLTSDERDVLSLQPNVLRLIDAESTELTGWHGVSILFASLGLCGMNGYARVNSFTYVMPVWTLEELQEYNSLLDDALKLREDVLIARYDKFGGTPRFVFTATEREHEKQLSSAISTFTIFFTESMLCCNKETKAGYFIDMRKWTLSAESQTTELTSRVENALAIHIARAGGLGRSLAPRQSRSSVQVETPDQCPSRALSSYEVVRLGYIVYGSRKGRLPFPHVRFAFYSNVSVSQSTSKTSEGDQSQLTQT